MPLPMDENRIKPLAGVSNTNPNVVLPVKIDPATGRVLVDVQGVGGNGGVNPFSLAENYFPVSLTNPSVENSGGVSMGMLYVNVGPGGYSVASIGGPYFLGYHKNMKIRFWCPLAYAGVEDIVYIYVFCDNANPFVANQYVGVRIMSGRVFFVSKDGTTEQATDITTAWGDISQSTATRDVLIELNAGSNAKIYINGSLAATNTTIPPISNTSSGIIMLCLRAETTSPDGSSAIVSVGGVHAYRQI